MGLAEGTPKDRATILAEQRTELSIERTVMASERSLMAWIRTSLSMIGFGFSIYKFFQYQADDIASGKIARPYAPRNLGLSLIALGTVALIAAAWQHRRFLNDLGAKEHKHLWSVSFTVSIMVILIGIITFYGVLLHQGPF
jgi:putative membrane protein